MQLSSTTSAPNNTTVAAKSTPRSPQVVQELRNFFTNLPINKKRDICLLFNILALQDRHHGFSLTKLPLFISLMQAMCYCIPINRPHTADTFSADMISLKAEILIRLKQYIAQPKARHFRQVCAIIFNIIHVVYDKTAMRSYALSSGNFVPHNCDDSNTGSDDFLRTYILQFVFVLLNDSLEKIIDYMCSDAVDSTRQHDLARIYTRLADVCKLWRLTAISFITDKGSSIQDTPIISKTGKLTEKLTGSDTVRQKLVLYNTSLQKYLATILLY